MDKSYIVPCFIFFVFISICTYGIYKEYEYKHRKLDMIEDGYLDSSYLIKERNKK